MSSAAQDREIKRLQGHNVTDRRFEIVATHGFVSLLSDDTALDMVKEFLENTGFTVERIEGGSV